MAGGKIELPHFIMTYNDGAEETTGQGDYKYLEWFTPATGFTVSQATIRHVERNLYYVYLTGSFATDAIPAYSGASIGNYVKSYFGDGPDGGIIAGYVPSLCAKVGTTDYRAVMGVFQVNGNILIRGATQDTGIVYINGPVIRREV